MGVSGIFPVIGPLILKSVKYKPFIELEYGAMSKYFPHEITPAPLNLEKKIKKLKKDQSESSSKNIH